MRIAPAVIAAALATLPFLPAFAAPACSAPPLLINEILAGPARDWDGSGALSTRDDEWIELLNPGAAPLDLTGWLITDGDAIPRFALSGVLEPGGHRVVFGREAYDWERAHGQIEPGLIVLIRTDFSKRWPDARTYLGTDERGDAAVAKLHFPSLHPDAARWLAEQRQVKAVGLDTASIDYGQSSLFESHRVLYERNIPAFENLTALDQLPPRGATVYALPMKIRGGSGSPLRAIASIPTGLPLRSASTHSLHFRPSRSLDSFGSTAALRSARAVHPVGIGTGGHRLEP